MNPTHSKPLETKVQSSKAIYSSVSTMGAFKQVSTRFDIASLTGTADNKPEPENRSLLELSRLMSNRNGETHSTKNPRKRRFDIASLTGTSTDDDSRSPGSPELDVVAVDSCSSTDSVPNKKDRNATPDKGDESCEDLSQPKNFSLPRPGSSDHGSAFRKIDKQADPSILRQRTDQERRITPPQQPRNSLPNSGPQTVNQNTMSSPGLPISPHSMFVPQSEHPMGASKFPFHEEPFNYMKLPVEMKSPPQLSPSDENRIIQHSRVPTGMVHQTPKMQSLGPPPPTPPNMDSFSSKAYSHPLLSFLPPSLAALSFPSQNWCAKCNATFRMTSDLVYHMRSHHKRETDTGKKKREEKLRCDICKESFRERHHLTRHMTSHQ